MVGSLRYGYGSAIGIISAWVSFKFGGTGCVAVCDGLVERGSVYMVLCNGNYF